MTLWQMMGGYWCVLAVVWSLPIMADDGVKDPVPCELFNGRDLANWVPVNVAPDTFSVRDGVIVDSGRPTGLLRTTAMYENFIAEFEWRHLVSGGNSGFFIWADGLPSTGTPFPLGIEIQILDNGYSAKGKNEWYTTHGDIFPVNGARLTLAGRISPNGARSFPMEERSLAAPAWNHYRIVANHGSIELSVNGKAVTTAHDAQPRKGYLMFEAEGSECQFRNFRFESLPSTQASDAQTARAADGFLPLFNGVDLRNWRVSERAAARWQTPGDLLETGQSDDGVSLLGAESALWTERDWGDVQLICDWRWKQSPESAAAGGGILLRGSPTHGLLLASGLYTGRVAEGSLPAEHGQLDIEKTSADAALWNAALVPAGRWNRLELSLQGQRVTANVNGQLVLDDRPWSNLPATGPIGLLPSGGDTAAGDQATTLQLRNVLIRELHPASGRAPATP